MLRLGSRGDGVSLIQQALIIIIGAGLPLSTSYGTRRPDGIFGPETLAAVQVFQMSAGLVADGIIGPKTITALDAATKQAGISALITGATLLLKGITGSGMKQTDPSLSLTRHSLQTALSPFDRDTWWHPVVPKHYFTSGPTSAGETIKAFAPAIPIVAPPIAEAVVMGVALIIAAVSKKPPVPVPKPAPPPQIIFKPSTVDYAALALSAANALIEETRKKVNNLIVLFLKEIEKQQENQDPRCQEAVIEAKEAVNDLTLRLNSVLGTMIAGRGTPIQTSPTQQGTGRDYTKLMDSLDKQIQKTLNAIGRMCDACLL